MLENANVQEINKAILILRELSADEHMRQIAEMREKALHDEASAINSAIKKGRAEGMAKGMEKGRAEGMAKGMEKGRAEGMAKGRAEERARLEANLRAMELSEEAIARALSDE